MNSFYVVSAMLPGVSLSKQVKHSTEEQAIECAKYAIEQRREQGLREVPFYVLKALIIVGPQVPPVAVTKLVDEL